MTNEELAKELRNRAVIEAIRCACKPEELVEWQAADRLTILTVNDGMVERASHRFSEVYFRNHPDDTLIDVEEIERAMLCALTAALTKDTP